MLVPLNKYILIIGFTVCLTLGYATGSNIITGQARAPIEPSSVKIISQLPEEHYEIIGIVTASSDAGWTEQGNYEYALVELKEQAAKIGANRILIENIGKSLNSYYSAGIFWQSSENTITGKALYVKKKKKKTN